MVKPSPPPSTEAELFFKKVSGGDKAALAEALARLERTPESPETVALLSRAHHSPRAHIVGVTGPPGVGKSTLLGVVIADLRAAGRSVGVIAVDPSSHISGGALLGDRTRIPTDPQDKGVFIRSMAARDRLGGLAALTVPAMVLMSAIYDVVLVETVGVGQSETDVGRVADTVVFCVQPGSGDALQFMKAGIIEIPHIVTVTKADMTAPAQATEADLRNALIHDSGHGNGQEKSAWQTRILSVSSSNKQGTGELLAAIDAHGSFMEQSGELARHRRTRDEAWLGAVVQERYGAEGLSRAGSLELNPGESPFSRLSDVLMSLETARS
jgi:LAO/AO transport system kinase